MGLITVLNLILFILIIVFIFKYILINFRLSESWLRNAIIIILLCISGYLAFYGMSTSLYVGQADDSLKYQLTQEVPEEEKAEMEEGLKILKKDKGMAVAFTLLGWGTFVSADIIQRKYMIKAALKPGKGKWNLNKYK